MYKTICTYFSDCGVCYIFEATFSTHKKESKSIVYRCDKNARQTAVLADRGKILSDNGICGRHKNVFVVCTTDSHSERETLSLVSRFLVDHGVHARADCGLVQNRATARNTRLTVCGARARCCTRFPFRLTYGYMVYDMMRICRANRAAHMYFFPYDLYMFYDAFVCGINVLVV